MKKLLLLILTALALTFLLASCGDEPNDPPVGDTKYNITFKIGENTYTKQVKENVTPSEKLLSTKELDGYTIVKWDKTFVAAAEDATYTAVIYSDETRVSATLLLSAYNVNPHYLNDPADRFKLDNTGKPHEYNLQSDVTSATALFTLALEEYSDPQGGAIADKIMEHLIAICYEGYEPVMDAWPAWAQMIYPAAFTLISKTETVTDKFVDEYADMKDRMDCIMRCAVILSTISSADWNDYVTGVGLVGNFNKGWNPNYRFANAMPIVNTVDYFGGPAAVNQIISDFAYDDYIADFEEYGFDGLKLVWTAFGNAKTVKALMENGTSTALLNNYLYDTKNTASGTGAGVHWPKEYTGFTYTGYSETPLTLTNYVDIAKDLLFYNFSGGLVNSGLESGKAYILKNGEKNPVLGKNGMMLEFSLESRSSYGYCGEDFICAMIELAFLDAMGLINTEDDADVFEVACVGLNDYLYKGRMGYHSYAWSGSHDDSDKQSSTAFCLVRSMFLRMLDSETMWDYYNDGTDI